MEKQVTCECGHEIVVRPESTATSLDCPACGREVHITAEPPEQVDAPPQPDARPEQQMSGRQPCPYCLEHIKPGARKCPFCQEYLDETAAPQPPQAPAPPQQPRTSGLAIASLILGVAAPFLGFLPALPAILLGVGGIAATRDKQVHGRGMAIVGLLLGLLWTAAIVGLVLLLSQALDSLPIELKPPSHDFLF